MIGMHCGLEHVGESSSHDSADQSADRLGKKLVGRCFARAIRCGSNSDYRTDADVHFALGH